MDYETTSVHPGAPLVVTVFGLGCGAMANLYGPLARQVTDEIAVGLSSFDGLLGRPHHLLDGSTDVLDPNFGEEPEDSDDGESPRVRFIVFSSLPADALIRKLTLAQGGRIAVSGRLVIDRNDVDLSLNMWDVARPNLLASRALFGAPAELPGLLARAIGTLAHSLGAAASLDSAVAEAQRSIGTESFAALQAYAAATDRLRRASLSPRGEVHHESVAQALCSALGEDPDYPGPRRLLVEHSIGRFSVGDTTYCRVLVEELRALGAVRLDYALLIFEALVVQGLDTEAAVHLRELERDYGGDSRVVAASERLTK